MHAKGIINSAISYLNETAKSSIKGWKKLNSLLLSVPIYFDCRMSNLLKFSDNQ
jgi:hypothetical protein